MRRRVVLFLAVLVTMVLGSVAPARAGSVVPFQARPRGHSYQEWLRLVGQFYLGDASDPLIAGLGGDCGELMDGVFFMAAPIEVGAEVQCDVPTVTPIVLSHAGFFATKGIDGNTDAELLAVAETGFTTSSDSFKVD